MDDGPHTRERLRQEWLNLVQRAEAAEIPTVAVIDTMIEVAVERYSELYGDDLAANLLRDLLLRRFPEPVAQTEVAQQLIAGEEEGPNDRLVSRVVVF